MPTLVACRLPRWTAGIAIAVLIAAAAAAAAAGDPRLRASRRDEALAGSVLVRRSELPAGHWRASPTDFSQPNPPCVVAHFNLSDLTMTGRAGVDFTEGPLLLIESTASVFVTARQAREAWRRTTRREYVRCVAGFLAKSLQVTPAAQVTISSADVRRIARMGDASAAFRILLTARLPRFVARDYVDGLSVRRGRVEADLVFIHNGHPWPTALETRLLELVARRLPRSA